MECPRNWFAPVAGSTDLKRSQLATMWRFVSCVAQRGFRNYGHRENEVAWGAGQTASTACLATYDLDMVRAILWVAFSDDGGSWALLTHIMIYPEMPRGQSDRPSESGLWAMFADMRSASEVVTLAEARALWCSCALDMRLARSGEALAISHISVKRNTERGLLRMSRWLRGEDVPTHFIRGGERSVLGPGGYWLGGSGWKLVA